MTSRNTHTTPPAARGHKPDARTLAERLRANLRRRKQQARARNSRNAGAGGTAPTAPGRDGNGKAGDDRHG